MEIAHSPQSHLELSPEAAQGLLDVVHRFVGDTSDPEALPHAVENARTRTTGIGSDYRLTMTEYEGEGSEAYGSTLHDHYPDLVAAGDRVKAFAGFDLAPQHLNAEGQVYLLSGGTALMEVRMRADFGVALRGEASTDCFAFFDAMRLGKLWYDFEREAVTLPPAKPHEAHTAFLLDDDTVRALAPALERFAWDEDLAE